LEIVSNIHVHSLQYILAVNSNVSLKSKPKGKNEPAKKKSKITVVGKNGINAVKITSFFPK
jgi:hypothetical protein